MYVCMYVCVCEYVISIFLEFVLVVLFMTFQWNPAHPQMHFFLLASLSIFGDLVASIFGTTDKRKCREDDVSDSIDIIEIALI